MVFYCARWDDRNKNVDQFIETNNLKDIKDTEIYNKTMTYLQTLSFFN